MVIDSGPIYPIFGIVGVILFLGLLYWLWVTINGR